MIIKKNILVASENASLFNELRILLKESQVQISQTKLKGAQLIEKLKINPPDLTILDIPDISTTEIKQIIAIRQVLDIPVILLDAQKIQQKFIEVVRFSETTTYKQTLPLKDLIERVRKILDGKGSGELDLLL